MTLREMVSREMRESCDVHPLNAWIRIDAAVDVALRLLSEWGHVKMCLCHDSPCEGLLCEVIHAEKYFDPRCIAQPGGEEGK